MPQPFTGPTDTDQIKAALGIVDTLDDAELDLIAAAVNTMVRALPVAQPHARTATINLTNASTSVTAVAGTFTPSDVSATISGPSLPVPAGTTLTATDASTATLSAAATGTGTYDVELEPGAWSPNVERGATMLGARLFRRRNSPSGVETFAGDGAVYVSRNDPDIAQLPQLGDYGKPAVG